MRVLLDGQTVLVKPDAALAQKQAEVQPAATGVSPRSEETAGVATPLSDNRIPGHPPDASSDRGRVAPPAARPPRRFHASVTLDPLRLGRDAGQIAEEVVQHLTRGMGVQVEITLEIHADLPEGASEKLIRDVTENCRTLRFKDYGFEEA